jgi:hypothetical protein
VVPFLTDVKEPSLLKEIQWVTGEATEAFQHGPETKHHNLQWNRLVANQQDSPNI